MCKFKGVNPIQSNLLVSYEKVIISLQPLLFEDRSVVNMYSMLCTGEALPLQILYVLPFFVHQSNFMNIEKTIFQHLKLY